MINFSANTKTEQLLHRHGIDNHPLIEKRKKSNFDIFTVIEVGRLIDNLLITKRNKTIRTKRARIKASLGLPLDTHDIIALGEKIGPSGGKKRFTTLEDNFGWYSDDLREQVTIPLLQQLDQKGEIGSFVIDWGSGQLPLADTLGGEKQKIRIDAVSGDHIDIVVDLTHLQTTPTFNREMFEQKLFTLLNSDASTFMIFSDILNYVHTKELLSVASSYQKPNDKILIVNGIYRGDYPIFHHKRSKTTKHIWRTLDTLGYYQELHKQYYPETTSFVGGIISETIWHEKGESKHVAPSSIVDVIVAKKL